ncbi:MAG: phosphoglycerate kinase [candidate division Zixibacteria bacterium]|nr:phosphoglycerate kinase [candidate division Zixibacteria bacterium]
MSLLSLADIDVRSKRALMRVDLNVPLDTDGRITDDTRIRAILPTLRHLLDHGGRVILISHLGRPKGISESLRLKPVAERLSELLGRPVQTAPDCIGEIATRQAADLKDGECLMLENIRFYPEEEKNDPDFARRLAALGDIYVNDAFGTSHRAHASTEGVTRFLTVRAAGFLMQKELDYLRGALTHPKRPLVTILGGAKVADKIAVTERFVELADTLIIGGGMAYTFLKSQGEEIGASLLDSEHIEFAGGVMERAKTVGRAFLLPIDHIIAKSLDVSASVQTVKRIPSGWMGLDIGPETQTLFTRAITSAGTILWNGPMGVFEREAFAVGTAMVAAALAAATDRGAVSIIGGGDTAAAVASLGLQDRMSHVSTGGGASLELLEGRMLPGVAALER